MINLRNTVKDAILGVRATSGNNLAVQNESGLLAKRDKVSTIACNSSYTESTHGTITTPSDDMTDGYSQHGRMVNTH